ncbi:MAG: ABC transporter permease subunit [Anaerolineae bacterium]|nr:ABC transporter permease subunit [Anaerolineae bacterium]
MVANTELQRVKLSGWRTGLANLLRKENRAWWGTRRWLVHSVLWTVVVNGVVAAVVFLLAPMVTGEPVDLGIEMLFKFGGMALTIGSIVLVHDATIGERQAGVTEWLLSKPVSRPAYVLSKLVAHTLTILVILVGLQAVLGYGLLSAVAGEPLPAASFLEGVAGLAMSVLFYLALTLMLGVLTANRIALLGASLGVALLGFVAVPLGATVSTWVMLTPFALIHVLPAVVLGSPLPLSVWVPIGITAFVSALFVVVTLARFERLEF